MPAPLMYFKRQLAAKIEASYGVIESLTNADAGFKVNDRDLKIVGDAKQREKSDGNLGKDSPAPEGSHTELTLQNYLVGRGAATPPKYADFWQACGMSVSAGVYTMTSDQSTWKSLSAWSYQDTRLKKARGLMGSAKISLIAGQPALIDWNFMGGWQETPSDVTMLSGQTFVEASPPPVFQGAASFTLASSTGFKISKAELDLGNQVALRQDGNSPGGFAGGWIGQQDPRLTLDPEAMTLATQNWYSVYAAAGTVNAVIVLGTAANNTITLTLTNLQLLKNPEDQERDGKLVDALGFQIGGLTIGYT